MALSVLGVLLPQVYYIHPDHLNTPRLIADATGTTVWRWDQGEPFGNDSPNADPLSTSTTFDFPLRFPGQYFDRETNLAYNMARDYDPWIGRYVESDPIGLRAGLNTYLYVLSNPLSYSDPFGLEVNVCYYSDAAGGFGHIGYGVGAEVGTFGFYPAGNPFGGPGQIKKDDQKDKECKVIQSTPDQDRCMLECRTERASNPGSYNLTSRQCTGFVRDCLKQCGLSAGTFSGNPPRPFYLQLPAKR